MRLVACDSCHTQYDVSGVAAAELTCRCGQPVSTRLPAPVDAAVERCGSCGASVGAAEGDCDYCGSALAGDPANLSLLCPECFARCADDARFCTACGVAFRPEKPPAQGKELPCPVCSRLMPPQQVGALGVNECTRCRGLWVPGEAFDALVARTLEAHREAAPGQQRDQPPRADGGNPARQKVTYRRCPECQAFMLRRNYRKSSGVIVDTCRDHGTWLDADELEQIAGFLLQGGQTSETLLAEERSAEAAYHRYRAQKPEPRSGGGFIATRRERGMASTLLDILGELVD